MELLNYSRAVIETHVVKLSEEINGEKKWMRVQKNGELDHWKPASQKEVPKNKLNGSVTESAVEQLELMFQKSDYGDQ